MAQVISNYTPSLLQFSASRLFFQNQNELLQKIWFLSPASIDVYYKYTFQQVDTEYFVQWWEFEWITLDHKVQDRWIVYKIWFADPKYKNVQCLTADLSNENNLDNSSIRWMVKSFPIVSWWIFLILLLLLSTSIWTWLFWINVVWAGILLVFTICKTISLFCKIVFQTKTVQFGWFNTSYQEWEDVLFLAPNVVNALKWLSEFQIIRFCYTGNCLYLLQDIHAPKNKNNGLLKKIILSDRTYTEVEKADLQQRTLAHIQKSDFLSNFI